VTEPTKNGPGETAASEPTETELDETQASESTKTEEAEASEPTGRARMKHSAPSERRSSAGRWVVAAALIAALSLASLGVSLWVLIKKPWTESSSETTTTAPPGSSPQQVADAKAKACAAYTVVSNAVNFRNTTEAEKEAAGANVRLAASLGHTYLLERIDPATPPALADAIRRYAANLEDVAMFSLAGVGTDDPAQAARVNDWGPLNTQITDLCK
jgi:hypothetical protein